MLKFTNTDNKNSRVLTSNKKGGKVVPVLNAVIMPIRHGKAEV
jgi:hypothetical protein